MTLCGKAGQEPARDGHYRSGYVWICALHDDRTQLHGVAPHSEAPGIQEKQLTGASARVSRFRIQRYTGRRQEPVEIRLSRHVAHAALR